MHAKLQTTKKEKFSKTFQTKTFFAHLPTFYGLKILNTFGDKQKKTKVRYKIERTKYAKQFINLIFVINQIIILLPECYSMIT